MLGLEPPRLIAMNPGPHSSIAPRPPDNSTGMYSDLPNGEDEPINFGQEVIPGKLLVLAPQSHLR